MFNQVKTYLAGKKTYLVSVLTVLYGAYEAYGVHHDYRVIAPYILASSLGAALRAAIAKVGVTVK